MVKALDEKHTLVNLPSARENKQKNNKMIDQALANEGVPYPGLLSDDDSEENSGQDGETDA